MDNIQKTEKTIARILDYLMELGIQDSFVSFTDIVGDPELSPFVADCFYWLEAEGIVRVRKYAATKDDFTVISPSLTSLGFKLLGQPVRLGDSEIKLASAVKDVSKSEKSYSQFGDFFGGLLGGFTKSIGS